MPERDEIYRQLQKITESEIFSRSGINVRLLSILVEASLKGDNLKEASIGAELFGNRYDPVKNDTKVRVYIHNLRKKLDAYYKEEGLNDTLLFEIEKGRYRVLFSEKKTSSKKRKKAGIVGWILAVLVLIVSFLILLPDKQMPFFWNKYARSKFPVTVLIGDHFTINGPIATGGEGIFRNFDINSESDFSEYIFNHPDKARILTPNKYPYITKMGPYCTRAITSFFISEEIDFNLMLASEWDKSMIGNENLVYIGQFKTMGFLKNVFFGQNPNFNLTTPVLHYTNPQTGETTDYRSRTDDEIVDYTIVSQFTGPNGNAITFFLSDNDIGVMRMVGYFTNPDSLAVFSDNNKIGNAGFTSLFRVSGWERTGFKQKHILTELKK